MKRYFNKTMISGLLFLFFTFIVNAQWTQTNAIVKGRINSLLAYNDTVIVGSDSGIFFSINNGLSWISPETNPPCIRVSSFAKNCNTVIAGTLSNGIFLSIDNGFFWARSNTGLTDTLILVLTVNKNIFFAGTYHEGIFRSDDNGLSWTRSDSGIHPCSPWYLF